MLVRRSSFALALAALVHLSPRVADACEYDPKHIRGCPVARAGEKVLPANAIFPSGYCRDGTKQCPPDWDGADRPAVWEPVEVPLATELAWFRLAEPRPTRLVGTSYARSYPYDVELLLGPPKTVAPQRPAFENVEVVLIEDPSDGGGFGCPDLDEVRMRIAVEEPGPAFALFYFGATPEDARDAAEPEISTSACVVAGGYDVVATAGESAGRSRANDGAFSRRGRYCVSVALMDVAGNVGERSEARCFATDDEKDPLVRFEEGKDGFLCFCRSSVGAPTGSAGLRATALVALGLAVARLRRARRASS